MGSAWLFFFFLQREDERQQAQDRKWVEAKLV